MNTFVGQSTIGLPRRGRASTKQSECFQYLKKIVLTLLIIIQVLVNKLTYHLSIFCPFQFLKKVEDNRVDNFRALNEIMGKTITTPKVRLNMSKNYFEGTLELHLFIESRKIYI